ncbi:MAG: hypothetical protein ACR2P5_05570 [Gammaproteobacteria bacterium]
MPERLFMVLLLCWFVFNVFMAAAAKNFKGRAHVFSCIARGGK